MYFGVSSLVRHSLYLEITPLELDRITSTYLVG